MSATIRALTRDDEADKDALLQHIVRPVAIVIVCSGIVSFTIPAGYILFVSVSLAMGTVAFSHYRRTLAIFPRRISLCYGHRFLWG